MAEEEPLRTNSEHLDALLGHRLPVLDGGFVRVIDYMGTDASIVQAARVSYGKGTRRLNEDRSLIRYLMRHQHTTPFEMCEIKLHVRVPMDTWRQWIRHRTASVNEYSTRYSIAIDAAERTTPFAWRRQSPANHQGSAGALDATIGEALSSRERQVQDLAREVYNERLEKGVAREQARKDLPLSTYTEAYWKIDLHNLLHFLRLRMDVHAQEEIRAYAQLIGATVVRAWCPITWQAFVDYRLESLTLSRPELQVLNALFASPDEALAIATDLGLLAGDTTRSMTREGREFLSKLKRLPVEVRWPPKGIAD